jgi:hypothetical protein
LRITVPWKFSDLFASAAAGNIASGMKTERKIT